MLEMLSYIVFRVWVLVSSIGALLTRLSNILPVWRNNHLSESNTFARVLPVAVNAGRLLSHWRNS